MRMTWLLIWFALGSTSIAQLSYDAGLGSLPNEQGWLFLTNPIFGAKSTQSLDEGALMLNTMAHVSEQAGYFSRIPILFEPSDPPVFDLSQRPLSIQFSMQQIAGTDVADTDPLALGERNRGGFAVIAISEDLAGIELQFQQDNIVALDDLNAAFPVGERVAFDTSDRSHDFEVILNSSGYTLSADGELLLAGRLRSYSTIEPRPPFPYTTPSFVFFGDNTGRASALTVITRFHAASQTVVGDCSQDGVVNQLDLACISTIEQRDAVVAELNTFLGDLDGNGDVSFQDFVTLADHYGTDETRYTLGNINLQDGVTFADFLILADNFGASRVTLHQVPEPESNATMLACIMCMCFVHRHLPAPQPR